MALMTTSRGPHAAAQAAELDRAYAQLDEMRARLDALNTEPRLVATVVEVRRPSAVDAAAGAQTKMLISLSAGNAMDINHYRDPKLGDAKVGDFVLLDRNTFQALEIVRDGKNFGAVALVEAVTSNGLVQGKLGDVSKVFRCEGVAVEVGDRITLDPSTSYVIGNLGKPASMSELAVKVNVPWDDIGGHDEAKAALQEAIELPLTHPGLFAGYGKKPIKGILLRGAPGLGKTLLAKAAATSIAKAHGKAGDASGGFLYVKGPEILNSYIGRSEEAIRGLFTAARKFKKRTGMQCLLYIDEADALLGKRDRGSQISFNATTVPQYLAEMDGFDDAACIVILSTNRAELLDPAVVRDGRIDRTVIVGRPSVADARAIALIHMRGRPVAKEEDGGGDVVEALIAALYADGAVIRDLSEHGAAPLVLRDLASGAMIAKIIEEATTRAMRRDIRYGRDTATGIALADVADAVERARQKVMSEDHRDVILDKIESLRIAQLAAPAG